MDDRFVEKFEYFAKRTEQDLQEIKLKVEKLWDFKAMLIGGTIVVSVICSALVSLAFFAFGVH